MKLKPSTKPNLKFSWISVTETIPGVYSPIAMLKPGWKELETRLGVTFGDYIDPDLGTAKGVKFETETGDEFGIESLAQAPTDFEYIRILVHIDLYDDKLTDYVENILIATGIKSTELTWTHDLIKFKPHEVWRQDDNGNHFLVETKPCKADATWLCNELTARGHKQMYWVKAA